MSAHPEPVTTEAHPGADKRPVLREFFASYFRAFGREFPWRAAGTPPFAVLVAEMLLRQTRAEQVAAVWPSLVELFPTPGALAAADPDALREVVRPLGLGGQRAEALTSMSLSIVSDNDGEVPASVEGLEKLPHVGLYASHAVASFVYGQRLPVVDANVLRVLGRIYGVALGADNRRSPRAWDLAWSILPETDSASHNYGLLDFAATICRPRNPLCWECPLLGVCEFGRARLLNESELGATISDAEPETNLP